MPACPSSDLVARMGYEPPGYAALFSAPYHIGKTVREDIAEYRRRSPVTHAKELQTPLLIHTTTNDEDVNVPRSRAPDRGAQSRGQEVRIQDLSGRARRPLFQPHRYQIREESRREIYTFLARYLHPPRPL